MLNQGYHYKKRKSEDKNQDPALYSSPLYLGFRLSIKPLMPHCARTRYIRNQAVVTRPHRRD
jgi:hypothetical protein